MTRVNSRILLVIWVIAVFISIVHGRLRCVQCQSNDNLICNENMKPEDIDKKTSDCNDEGEDLCMKTKVNSYRTSWTAKNGKYQIATTKISRFCGKSLNYPWTGCSWKPGKAGESWVCACTDEVCNSSNGLKFSMLAMVVATIARYLL